MKSDIEIAESATLRPISEIAQKLGLTEADYEPYGKLKAKVTGHDGKKRGKLILVTAINPTVSGEGKTTVSIGLADSMNRIGLNVCLALREPSLGPVFGMKGGATGGGMAQIAPMADINLHFTGDLHAITAANNLLSAMIDNHIYWGNPLGLKTVVWKRCLDCNDRALRNVVVGLGGANGSPREDGYNITAASEVMAVLCLAADVTDLKRRLGNIVVGFNGAGTAVTARDLKADEAMTILLKEAIHPNLVQTLEGVPALVHGGPFANIAHGCNTVIATKAALSYADYVITEAGFGADLGAEKFLDIKCRTAGLKPSCAVIVATVRALKSAGGADKSTLSQPNADALDRGMCNLIKHIENMNHFGLPVVVAINRFVTDTAEEIESVRAACAAVGAVVAPCNIWEEGGKGGEELARTVQRAADAVEPKEPCYTYDLTDPIALKLEKIATKIYGARGIVLSADAKKQIAKLEADGYANFPVCVAKTQYSLSDNPTLIGRPEGFDITVREVQLRAGAGFLVAVCGNMLLMPGLPIVPNAERMTIDSDGVIRGLS